MIEKRIMEAEKMGFKKVMIPLVTYNKLEKKEKYKRRFKGIVFETPVNAIFSQYRHQK